MKGVRHGYGVRRSAVHSRASHCRPSSSRTRSISLTSVRSQVDTDHLAVPAVPAAAAGGHVGAAVASTDARIGFFLKAHCEESTGAAGTSDRRSPHRSSLTALNHQNGPSAPAAGGLTSHDDFGVTIGGGDGSSRSSSPTSTAGGPGPHQRDTVAVADDAVETYTGEWKDDKRSGFGISERSDGLKFEGEWYNNSKNGYGATTYADGTKEEGKYKNNVLTTSGRKFPVPLRASKIRERVDAAVASAQRAAQIALQKSEITNSR